MRRGTARLTSFQGSFTFILVLMPNAPYFHLLAKAKRPRMVTIHFLHISSVALIYFSPDVLQ